MLIFDSIRIRNFRAIKELTFQPKTDGITGIFGPNGQGKTSILIGVLFALYGVRPKGVNVGSLRRIGSGKEECSVSVVFTHLGQKIEVIRELKGANNNVVVNIYVNGRPETVTSVGAADRWMQKRFGIDGEGFLTAFVIRQKELDSFVQAVPSERKKIIEKLAGVETINKALQSARDSEKDSRKTVDLLPGSAESVENAGSEVDFYTSAQETAETELEQVRTKLTELQTSRIAKERKVVELREQENNLFRIETQISSMQTELTSIDAQLERVLYTETMAEGEDADSLRATYRALADELNVLRSQGAALTHSRKALEDAVFSTNGTLEAKTAQFNELPKFKAAEKKSWVKEKETAEASLAETVKQVDRLETYNNDLAISVDLLKHSPECPTCHTHLEDPLEIVNQFKETIVKNEAEIVLLTEKAASLRGLVAEIDAKMVSATQASALEEEIVVVKAELQTKQDELTNLADASELEKQIEVLLSKQEVVAETGRKAASLDTDRKQFAELTERKRKLADRLDTMRDDASLIELNFNKKLMQEVVNDLAQSQTLFEQYSARTAELTAAAREASLRFESARSNYKRLYEQWEKKRVLLDAHARHTLTTDMLEKFRQETVASIAPELSDYATSLISEMTNGDFIEVRLDHDFKASLVDKEGVERQSSWLSGGEESALALALRLATAFLITGGNSDLLWLDEPLTAQDADRRAAILSMIRKLPINQIIMINHAQEAKDIVDYEVTLGKDSKAG